MPEAIVTLHVDDELAHAFADVAQAQDRTVAELLRDLVRDVVQRGEAAAYDAWFGQEVEDAMREADDSTVERIPHEEVMASMRRRCREAGKRVTGKSR